MRKTVIVYEENDKYERLLKLIDKNFTDRGFHTDILCIKEGGPGNEYASWLKKSEADFICTLDLAGFQLNTLLDTPMYNILKAKQMHVLINEDVFPLYAEKEFALNLFLFVPEDAEKWRLKYPHILNMEAYASLEIDEDGFVIDSEFNRNAINQLVDRLMWDSGEDKTAGIR